MKYKISKGNENETPQVYLERVDDRYQIEAVQNANGEVYYLSITHELQEAGYTLIDTKKVMRVNYCGQHKTKKLYKLEKVK
ncbi:hypothetical protein [Bacillus massiliigorillae]|uniref:hypothetical protein n=1 Tax=Bacillus massiliigorillae TaxID=1243664 RepID=UPI00039C9DD0|nr:hypothetical protein [Bacillus massiliigorillae]